MSVIDTALKGQLGMRVLARSAIAMALGVVGSLSAIHDAGAASAACRRLEAQLASTGVREGGRQDNLAARQRVELNKARGQLARCGFFGTSRTCDSLRSTIRRMERNLASIERRAGGGATSRQSRSRILAALDANGCRGGSPEKMVVARKVAEPSFFSSLFVERGPDSRRVRETGTRLAFFGEPRRNAPQAQRRLDEGGGEFRDRNSIERRRDAEAARRGVGAVYGGDSFQSMCVRLSDGYYFPISPSSSRSNLRRDRNNCQAMCPGSEVSVYYKRLDQDDAATMISADTGKPYGALATANRYRETPAGACNGDRQAAQAAMAATKTVDFEFPVPMPRPGSDNTIPLWIGSADAAVATPPPEQRKVRVVGPAFLPDPPAATAQPVQAPTPVL